MKGFDIETSQYFSLSFSTWLPNVCICEGLYYVYIYFSPPPYTLAGKIVSHLVKLITFVYSILKSGVISSILFFVHFYDL